MAAHTDLSRLKVQNLRAGDVLVWDTTGFSWMEVVLEVFKEPASKNVELSCMSLGSGATTSFNLDYNNTVYVFKHDRE